MKDDDKKLPGINRRKFLASAAALSGGTVFLSGLQAQEGVKTREPDEARETTAAANRNKPLMERIDPKPTHPPGQPGRDYTPVVTPNNISLPWKIVNGVKVYHPDRRGGGPRICARSQSKMLGLQRPRPRPDDRSGGR